VAEKIAISLGETLLNELEALRKRTGESRSALIRRALDQLLATERRREQVAAYVDGYRRQPESEASVAAALAQTQTAWATIDDGEDW